MKQSWKCRLFTLCFRCQQQRQMFHLSAAVLSVKWLKWNPHVRYMSSFKSYNHQFVWWSAFIDRYSIMCQKCDYGSIGFVSYFVANQIDPWGFCSSFNIVCNYNHNICPDQMNAHTKFMIILRIIAWHPFKRCISKPQRSRHSSSHLASQSIFLLSAEKKYQYHHQKWLQI